MRGQEVVEHLPRLRVGVAGLLPVYGFDHGSANVILPMQQQNLCACEHREDGKSEKTAQSTEAKTGAG